MQMQCISGESEHSEPITLDPSIAKHFRSPPIEISSDHRETLDIMCEYYRRSTTTTTTTTTTTDPEIRVKIGNQHTYLQEKKNHIGKLLLLAHRFGAEELRKSCMALLRTEVVRSSVDDLKQHWCAAPEERFSVAEEEIIIQQNICSKRRRFF
jgi:D-lyxose ketol-isomerase